MLYVRAKYILSDIYLLFYTLLRVIQTMPAARHIHSRFQLGDSLWMGT